MTLIFVVENEALIRFSATEALSIAGNHAREAANADDDMDLLERRSDVAPLSATLHCRTGRKLDRDKALPCGTRFPRKS